ncbi:tryptophan--tRNA ligase [Coelomomyces lativittatus]|nr:tryptophan--tRNA ligase [Coelomomyces lativittatus]
MQNARDIMACGFKPDKTFIFANTQYVGGAFYHNISRVAKAITTSASKATFGFNDSDSVGKLHFVAIQASPSFSSSFPHIFGKRHDIPCLIPCAIDQDPYFRLTRDVAPKLGFLKPSLIHSKFFPALQGSQSKMSASLESTAIFMSDTPKLLASKINKYAFSGGKDTIEEHRKYGGNPEIDTAYQYLTFFMESDEKLTELAAAYRSGTLLSGELKKICIDVLADLISNFQKEKATLTDELIKQVMDFSSPMPWAVQKGFVTDLIPSFELLSLNSSTKKEKKNTKS